MSLRINTNIPAMSALRSLNNTVADMNATMNRLSTGLRINSAAEDPAGLIISEGMRSQLKGLDTAIRNSQDALNMTKTAESALNEVSLLLRNIRGLAVHSANTAVVDAAQLQANQNQILSTLSSIRRIATDTAWGTKKLLNGAAGVEANVTQPSLVSSLYIGGNVDGSVVASGIINMTRTTAATRANVNLANTYADTNALVNSGSFVINGVPFTTGGTESVANLIQRINQVSGTTNVVASTYTSGPNIGIALTSTKYGSNFGVNFLETTDVLNGGNVTSATGVDAVFDVTVPMDPSGTATETFTGGQGPGVDGLTLTSPSGNRMVLTTAGNGTAASTDIGGLTVGSMRFQIGPNSDQSITFSMPNIDPSKLGTAAISGLTLADLDVTTSSGAQNAMKIIDAAITEIAQLRGDLGSFQADFLESHLRSLAVAKENLTASESEIRDADVAEEMTKFTKSQILQQSGMAMLAHSNQSAQSVLSLLKQ